MSFIALLRGINVGGNNKVAMSELKTCFESLGFEHVLTYINSGNVIFESSNHDKTSLVKICEQAIEAKFGFHIICSVISADELQAALANAPDWWGADAESKHNVIFVIPPKSASDIALAVGDAKPEYEQVAAYGSIIFWSAPLETFSRTRYSKIAGTEAYKFVTIRNANTTKKLLQLTQ